MLLINFFQLVDILGRNRQQRKFELLLEFLLVSDIRLLKLHKGKQTEKKTSFGVNKDRSKRKERIHFFKFASEYPITYKSNYFLPSCMMTVNQKFLYRIIAY